MAHRALALKYRPQVFPDLVGQEHVTAVLERAVESGRVAHAYLFTGARGVGKTTSARILAKALNCERRASGQQKGADPCNECTSCTEITAGVSLDVSEIDGASNRGIADVQALREKVNFTPTGGKYRVVIIDEVHQLSNDAFAALLKTLEEPPAHLVFIFATTDPQKLPDTIRSRTQRFDFARVPLRKVADRLQVIARREREDKNGVHFTLSEGAALLIAQKSEGSMRDAVSALDQVVSADEKDVNEELVRRVLGIADREAYFTMADAITRHDPRATLTALHAAFAKGLDPRDIAEGLSEHIRHLLILAVDPAGADDLIPASQADIERMRAQTKGWSEHDLLRLLRLASEVGTPMKDSPQPLVHLEAAVLQMATLEPGETLAMLLAKLEALEQRLTGGAPPSSGSAPAPAGRTGTAPVRASAPARPGSYAAAPAPTPVRPGAGAGAPRASAMAPVAPKPVTPPMPVAPVVAPMPIVAPMAIAPLAVAVSAPVRAVAFAAVPADATAVAVADDVAGPPIIGVPAEVLADGPARWASLVARINEKKPLLGAFLADSAFVSVDSQALVVAMDDLHRAVVDDKENRALIAAEIPRLFGRAYDLRCVAPQERTARRRPTHEEIQPAIERAIAWCDGEIIEGNGRAAERSPNG